MERRFFLRDVSVSFYDLHGLLSSQWYELVFQKVNFDLSSVSFSPNKIFEEFYKQRKKDHSPDKRRKKGAQKQLRNSC